MKKSARLFRFSAVLLGMAIVVLPLLTVHPVGSFSPTSVDRPASFPRPNHSNAMGLTRRGERGARDPFAGLALSFEPNVGQADRSVRFISRSNHQSVSLSPNEAVLRVN